MAGISQEDTQRDRRSSGGVEGLLCKAAYEIRMDDHIDHSPDTPAGASRGGSRICKHYQTFFVNHFSVGELIPFSGRPLRQTYSIPG